MPAAIDIATDAVIISIIGQHDWTPSNRRTHRIPYLFLHLIALIITFHFAGPTEVTRHVCPVQCSAFIYYCFSFASWVAPAAAALSMVAAAPAPIEQDELARDCRSLRTIYDPLHSTLIRFFLLLLLLHRPSVRFL